MTSIALDSSNYGKSAVRLVAVARDDERHELRDLTVDVMLEGDFAAAHVTGDNAELISTDAMRNAVYVLAKEQGVGEPERFGIALGRHFLAAAAAVRRATIRVVEHPWARLAAGGVSHAHAFQRGTGGRRVARTLVERDRIEVEAGIEELGLLRTTGSGWSGFLRERCTTLPETDDRILATTVAAHWRYAGHAELDFDRLWEGVRETLLAAFADHFSPSVQFTLHHIGEAVLAAHAPIERIRLSLPNQHHLLFDLSPFGLQNENEVFVATTEPYGLIEGTIVRTESR